MAKTSKIIIGLIIVLVLIIVGGWFILSKNQNSNTIKIGSIGILTGQGASWGVAAKNGMQMAIDDINAAGGINGKKLQGFYEDDQGDAQKSISAFQKLTDVDGISFIIGTTWSSTGIPLVKLANDKKVLMVSPSLGKPEFNEGSKYLFNTWPHDVILSANLADYVYQKGHRNVALIGAEELWVKDQTNAFKKRFEQLGGRVEVLVEPNPSDKDINTEALKIKNDKNIDAIISTTDGVLVGSLVAKRVKELGVFLPIYSITIDADAIKAADGAYEGMEYLTFLTPALDFKQKYEKRFGQATDIGADSAYDAVMLVANAMKETKSSDATVLANYLAGIREYKGVSGNLKSDSKRGFIKEYSVEKVVNGKSVDL